MSLCVDIQRSLDEVVVEASHIVTCDFVAGWAFGDAIGIGIRSVYGWWTVTQATSVHPNVVSAFLPNMSLLLSDGFGLTYSI